MWLTLDIGNSSIKAGLFDGRRLESSWTAPRTSPWGEELAALIKDHQPSRVGIASVVPAGREEVATLLKDLKFGPAMDVSHRLSLPLELEYQTPETLGTDRLAAAVAAYALHSQGRPTIIVDAGSAVTVDVVINGQFLGGSIGAGPDVEAQLLGRATASLPTINVDDSVAPIGTNTHECLAAGITFGLIDRVQGSLDRLQRELGAPCVVVLTGGWHALVAQHVKGINHVDPHLVLRGIQILMAANPP